MARRLLLALVLTALLPASASAASLAHHTWRVTRIGGDDVRSSHQRLRFFGRHDFSGRGGGCGGRDFGGHYRATGTRLRFKDVYMTAEGCDGPGPPPGPSIGSVIFDTRSYRITGRKLELLGRRGRTLAVLRRR
jgi:heat shock protein HslJ